MKVRAAVQSAHRTNCDGREKKDEQARPGALPLRGKEPAPPKGRLRCGFVTVKEPVTEQLQVRILRQESPAAEPRWETFKYDGPADNSVAGLLDYLNYNDDITDADGNRTTRISWEHACMQGMCGACAMVINGTPALACETFLRDFKGKEITIRPLRKFPVIRDLIVDRTVIQENLMNANMYIGEYKPSDGDKGKADIAYAVAKCLKCGLCMEVCPNYVNGKNFFGAAFANDCYLVASRNSAKAGEIRKIYGEHFGSGCSKDLSCMKVCPAGIPILGIIARMNR